MSLVNDSLQDLEARRGQDSLANYTAASVRLGASEKQRGARKALLFGAALMAVAAGIYSIQPATLVQTEQAQTEIVHTEVALTETIQPTAKAPNKPVKSESINELAVGNSVASKPTHSQSAYTDTHTEEAYKSTYLPENALYASTAENSRITTELQSAAPLKETLATATASPTGSSHTSSSNSAIDIELNPIQQKNSTTEKTIALLLNSAANALAADQLTTPADSSANSYYQQVLLLEPKNQQAQQGISSIVQRYTELAQQQVQQGNLEQALTLTQRGLSLSPEQQALRELHSDLTQRKLTQPQLPSSSPIASIDKNNPATKPVITVPSPTDTKALTVEQAPTKPVALSVQPSSASTDSQQSARAKAKAESGDISGAVSDLENLSRQHQLGRKGTSLLADLYLQLQRPDDATALVQQQALLPETEAAYIIARSQVQDSNLAAALVTLEAHTPAIESNPDYYALLAGVYQQGGQYRQAVSLYKRLASQQPETFTHWLGLAAALDNLREPTALAAFRRVLPMIPKQQTELKYYVQQRISLLSKAQLSTDQLSTAQLSKPQRSKQ